MSRWDDQFADHPGGKAGTRLLGATENLSPGDPDALPEVERLRRIAAFVQSALDRADPELVSVAILVELDSVVNSVIRSIDRFRDDPNIAHIQSANNEADSLLIALARLPGPREPADFDDMRERASSYRRSVGQLLHQIADDTSGLRDAVQQSRSDLQGIRSDVEDEQARAKARLEEFVATISQQESRLDTAIARVEEQFSNAEAQRAQRFEELTNDNRKDANDVVQELRQSTAEKLDILKAEADLSLGGLHGQEQDARRVVSELGGIGVSGGYGEYAKQQKQSADRWQLVTVASLLLFAAAALYTLSKLPAGGVEWEHFTTRLVTSLSLIGLAGYAASQSSKHRRVEREARKAEIELAVLNPYLALFDPAERDRIKAEVALRMFGQPLAPDDKGGDKVGASQLVDLLRQALSALNKTQ
jgi:hypothetical protein